jgi:hypothetical protein
VESGLGPRWPAAASRSRLTTLARTARGVEGEVEEGKELYCHLRGRQWLIRQLHDEADEEPNTIREKGMCVAGHTQELRCRGRSIRRARGSPA